MIMDNQATSFRIREATAADVPALAQLHVDTFNETHTGGLRNGPSYALRAQQWGEVFRRADPDTFCFVIEDEQKALIGFASGEPYSRPELPQFSGHLNKIYLLRMYHRRGLGKLLLGRVVERFLSQGITSMVLFGEASNPTNGFYEAMGGERLYAPNGDFHGAYGWRDLQALAARCRAS
jgi:L-amino acid N-acyltransferase YncA